ncbi:GTP cyclohydrolase II [Dissophora globulifera]|uniref:GTP cyclohydrolase II n=1 Tax=Dissophora globulifera TaxID=979702 RepID=A0A9P6RQ73_9FUNG|nr:GTP cyclohydrolase II [Dissophora globulifera]
MITLIRTANIFTTTRAIIINITLPDHNPTLTPINPQVTATSAASAAVASGSTKPDDPLAWCTARARIPTPDGSEYFLLIYENKLDKKEHLAFVFSDSIRSRSLDKVQPGETEMDRIKRGAYLGRLQPSTTAVQDQNQCNLAATATTATTATTMTMTTTSVVEMVVDQEQGPSTVMEVEDNMAVTLSASSTTSLSKPLAPLVRIHSECFTGEIGHSARCDCGEQLDEAIRLMKAEGSGVVVYLRQEGRGIGLGEKLKAYNLQDLGYDTVMANLLLNHGADERTYEVAQAILLDLGLDEIRLLTNNPDKIEQVELSSNIKVVERVPMVPKSWEAIVQGTQGNLEVKEGAVENKIVKGKELDRYLKVKVERMRHLISIPTSL